ncbi:GNAT family N-acetyltransferase [Novosphingobium mangrovi (ex Huang et al. 2023)]|uniref:GNAT family N-acetyltransferase n=1 Tax=Novosphingobium mangrovi (ex Huang et al. 2023) TaxID=2976432 RepID=A0ABT2I1K3_9SPHN|nr:GNAT family N-acetyltransferase [Novosphingobium mangrovi (ex Huang et al. 2023)]MCT2398690.1 GNAT family N-acetyltransferase [Novosphingobium mangrovi (ex Huang et al. 2023)]
MDRQPVLEGDRLSLRPLRPDDWRALYVVASDPQIWAGHPSYDRWQEPVFRKFFADAMTRGGALAIIDKHAQSSAAGAGGEIIGSSQFDEPELTGPGEIEIGWSFLARKYWGRGYNAEFKRLMLAHALAHYERAIFQVGEDNAISRKAMENIGGVLTDRTRMLERGGGVMVRHVIYEVTREGLANGPLGRG